MHSTSTEIPSATPLADFVEACHRAGVKATPQRIEILRLLAATTEHPDAETLYAQVSRRIPSISLDTVYRTLRTFEEKGVIARIGPGMDRARFDADTSPHHHFLCVGCGRVIDFRSPSLDAVCPPPEAAQVGRIDATHVVVRGQCAACAAAAVDPLPSAMFNGID